MADYMFIIMLLVLLVSAWYKIFTWKYPRKR